MTYDVAADIRLDPRLKAILAGIPVEGPAATLTAARRCWPKRTPRPHGSRRSCSRSFMDLCDTEEAAPSAGLRYTPRRSYPSRTATRSTSRSSGPDNDEDVACVYYIHGGGMASLSCYDGMYRGWGKLIAANGVAVVMVDFRNCVVPSSVPEVAPFPAGLNDCVSGLKWVVANARAAGHRPGPRHRRGRERRRQPDPRNGPEAQAGRRSRPDQGPVRDVPVYRRPVADAGVPVLDREQRDPARPAQQPRRGRATGSRPSPSATRWPGRPSRPTTDVAGLAADGDQRQRVRSAA